MIDKKPGESKSDFIGRCMSIEIKDGKEQAQAYAICEAKWSNLAGYKVSFDYDGTLSTSRGKELAKSAINRGDVVYIISARSSKEGMLATADELGIPHSRVYATGSNSAKEAKVKELGVNKHYDNNPDVVKALPNIGHKFGKVRRVLFGEDFNEEDVRKYKELGYKVQVLSRRKIQRADKKVYNKLKSVGLTEDHLVFGSVKELNDRYDYDLLLTGKDPILEKLMIIGEPSSKYRTISFSRVESLEDAEVKASELLKSVDLKFAKILTRYRYVETPGIPAAASGSRPFCSDMMTANRLYSLEDIKSLPTSHLADMKLPEDVFVYRGGFYHNPDSGVTTPYCRHYWQVEVVIQN